MNIQIWDRKTKIASLLAIDTETTITPSFTITPEMVLGSVHGGGDTTYILRKEDVKVFFEVHRASTFILQNAPFDMDVLKKIEPEFNYHALYDTSRIMDVGILYRLWHLATKGWVPKRHNMKVMAKELLNIEIDKSVEERVTFGQFLNTLVEDIPSSYLDYAAQDAVITYQLYFKLRQLIGSVPNIKTSQLLSHHIQVKGDLALNHIYKRGIGFDVKRRDRWFKAATSRLDNLQNRLATWGWVRGKKGNQEVFESIVNMLGFGNLLPRTEDGHISSKAEDLMPYKSDFEFIQDYLAYNELEKISSFVKDQVEDRIHPRYDTLKNTGRTGASKPNIQNLPRKGVIRSMYKAKEGHTFLIIDYNAIELACLGQVCLSLYGKSEMARLINEGECLHYNTAVSVYRKPMKDILKDERQFAKIPNFAFPTNMKPETFVDYCKQYDIEITPQRAADVKNTWSETYPEIKRFWTEPGYGATDHTTLSGRIRANAFYTAYLNTFFQGMAADGAKLAMYEADKAGLDVVAFIHDELVFEVEDCKIEEMVPICEKVMIDGMKKVVTDVNVAVETTVSKRYMK